MTLLFISKDSNMKNKTGSPRYFLSFLPESSTVASEMLRKERIRLGRKSVRGSISWSNTRDKLQHFYFEKLWGNTVWWLTVQTDRQMKRWDRYLFAREVPGEEYHLSVFDSAVYSQSLPLLQHTAGHCQFHLHHLWNWETDRWRERQ